jgi:hypothetical protein
MHTIGNKGDRAVRDRAYALAEGGHFKAVHEVERALISEGWPNVGTALDSEYTRKAIAERCAAARPH